MAATTPVCDFGRKAKDFDLEGVDGGRVRLAELKGSRGTLVMFICNHCPYVKAAIDRLVRDCAELQTLGISSVAIMPNDTEGYPEDSFENMQAFAAEHRFGFPYAIDRTQEVARAYGAVCTPDFFGFNAALELQYRGRIDDAGPRGTVVKRRELFEAMKAVAKTGRGPAEQVPSMGCSIKWRHV
ncbi:MAG: thioredoxin family protein [Rhodospirillales bacterium]|nr:thioredoxin family protein [Rhodospirillales bacterium]